LSTIKSENSNEGNEDDVETKEFNIEDHQEENLIEYKNKENGVSPIQIEPREKLVYKRKSLIRKVRLIEVDLC